MTNQSKLVETILSILGITDRTSGNRPEQIATLEQELIDYITANYTPKDVTSEKDYVTSTSDESKKLCNQSELEQNKVLKDLRDILETRHAIAKGSDEFTPYVVRLYQYITANYTPNSKHYSFTTYRKPSRVQSLDRDHISITSSGISFGKTKPPYTRTVIEFDKQAKVIRFHEPTDEEYGISYKIGVNPSSGVYGFRARPFIGILPCGYYKKIEEHTYVLKEQSDDTQPE